MTSAERVAVIGTGLLGTSIGLAALRAGDAVRGVDVDPGNAAAASARLRCPVDAVAGEALAWASVVVIATPMASVADAVIDRKSTRLNSSHVKRSRMPSSA